MPIYVIARCNAPALHARQRPCAERLRTNKQPWSIFLAPPPLRNSPSQEKKKKCLSGSDVGSPLPLMRRELLAFSAPFRLFLTQHSWIAILDARENLRFFCRCCPRPPAQQCAGRAFCVPYGSCRGRLCTCRGSWFHELARLFSPARWLILTQPYQNRVHPSFFSPRGG